MSLDSCGCPKRWRGTLGYKDPCRSVGHALSLSMRGGRKGKEGNGRVRRVRWAIVEDQQVTATLPSRSGGRVSSESYTKKALHER